MPRLESMMVQPRKQRIERTPEELEHIMSVWAAQVNRSIAMREELKAK